MRRRRRTDLHSERGAERGDRPGRAKNPVIKVDLAWLEFEKPDLDAAERFAHAFGFVTAARTADTLYLRGARVGTQSASSMMLAHPQVTAASAVGRPEVHAGEVPVAYVTLAPAATVTEDDLRDWASQRLPDRTAAPKTVTVLDALPLTAVGKPYKLGLRADATRRELRTALDTVAGVHNVDATVEGSSIVAVVTVSPSADQAAIKAIVARYAIESRLEVMP